MQKRSVGTDNLNLSKKAEDESLGDFLLAIRRRFDVSISMSRYRCYHQIATWTNPKLLV